MKSYAYLDTHGILHSANEKPSDGRKYVETDLPHKSGYFLIDGEEAVMYSPDEIHVGGNRTKPALIDPETAPRLAELYEKLL